MSSNTLKSVNLTSSPVFKLLRKKFLSFSSLHSFNSEAVQVVQAPLSILSDFMIDSARMKYIPVTP